MDDGLQPNCTSQCGNRLTPCFQVPGLESRADATDQAVVRSGVRRFAHLFLLRTTLGLPAFLLNVLFTDDPHSPTSPQQWKEGLVQIHGLLGISEVPDCYAEVLLPAVRG